MCSLLSPTFRWLPLLRSPKLLLCIVALLWPWSKATTENDSDIGSDHLKDLLRNVDSNRPLLGAVYNNVAEKGLMLTVNVLSGGQLQFSETVTSGFNSSSPQLADQLKGLRKRRKMNRRPQTGSAGSQKESDDADDWSDIRSTVASTSNNLALNGLFLTINLLLGGAGQGSPAGYDRLDESWQCPPLSHRHHQQQTHDEQGDQEDSSESQRQSIHVQNHLASTTGNTAKNGLFVTLNYFAGSGPVGLQRSHEPQEEEEDEDIVLRIPIKQIVSTVPALQLLADKFNLDNLDKVFP